MGAVLLQKVRETIPFAEKDKLFITEIDEAINIIKKKYLVSITNSFLKEKSFKSFVY